VFGAHLSVAAEPASHIQATVGCLCDLWDDHRSVGFRQPVTGYLLRQLVRERERDYPIILRTVLGWARGSPGLIDNIQGWLRGHFMLEAVLGGRR
jgi:hypothetical protein